VTRSEGTVCRVADFSESEFERRITTTGVGLRIGPFNAHVQVLVDSIIDPLRVLYSDYPVLGDDVVHSFHVRIEGIGRFGWRTGKLVRFSVDGQVPHEDLPAEQALAVLEWGINLVIALRCHSFLMLHSAILEKNGQALLLPAAPGFGKTTLCTALVHNGWRLLSDEFGLIRPGSNALTPVPRPMALKNQSISVIRSFCPEAVIGPPIANTRKGTIAHVKPPAASVSEQHIGAEPRLIIFPRWMSDSGFSLERLPRADGFMMLAMNAFNYELLGESAFRTVTKIIDQSDCYRLEYSDLGEAIERINEVDV
jgi:HprK-related kinase A